MSNPILLPQMTRQLSLMGENIRLARLRRHLSIGQVSERSGVSSDTVDLIENGDPDVSLREYLSVLRTLNMEKDIYNIASNDILGRKLQDIELLKSNDVV